MTYFRIRIKFLRVIFIILGNNIYPWSAIVTFETLNIVLILIMYFQ